MNITIESIPHKEQRYETVGDWLYDPKGALKIKVSTMSDPRYEFLVAIHELIEVKLCEQAGVTQEQVDKFDMAYEKTRPDGDDSEPGDHPEAPYRKQHFTATTIERQLAEALGVDWNEYDKEIQSL